MEHGPIASEVEDHPADISEDDCPDDCPPPPKRTCSEKLEDFINERREKMSTDTGTSITSGSNILNDIKKEMNIYEKSGRRTPILDKVNNKEKSKDFSIRK